MPIPGIQTKHSGLHREVAKSSNADCEAPDGTAGNVEEWKEAANFVPKSGEKRVFLGC